MSAYKRIPLAKLQRIAKGYKISINTKQKFTSKKSLLKGQFKPKTREQLVTDILKKSRGKRKLDDALYQKRGQERPRATCPPYRGKRGSKAGGVQGYSSFNADVTKIYGSAITIDQRKHIWEHCRDKDLNKAQLRKYIETYLKKKPPARKLPRRPKPKTNADMKREIKKALDKSVTKGNLRKIGKILDLDL